MNTKSDELSSKAKNPIELLSTLSPSVIIQEPPKTNFNIYRAIITTLGVLGMTGKDSDNDKKDEESKKEEEEKPSTSQLKKTEEAIPSLKLPEFEDISCSDNIEKGLDCGCVDCSELGPQTPFYDDPPLSLNFLKIRHPSFNPATEENLKTVESQAKETMALIRQAKKEIAEYSQQKLEMSEQGKGKIEASTGKLGQKLSDLEALAEKVMVFPIAQPSTGGDGELNTKGVEEIAEKKVAIENNAEDEQNASGTGGQDHSTDLLPIQSCSSEIVADSRRIKIKEEMQQIRTDLESQLAGCDLSTVDGSITLTGRSLLEFEGLTSAEDRMKSKENSDRMSKIVINDQQQSQLAEQLAMNQLSLLSDRSMGFSSHQNDSELVASMTNRLKDSYKMQEHLAYENKNLEDTRFQLQEELLLKETETDRLQRNQEILHKELTLLKKENQTLIGKLDGNAMKDESKFLKKEIGGLMDEDIEGLQNEIQRLRLEMTALHTQREELMARKLNVQQNESMLFPSVDEKLAAENKNYQALEHDFEAALQEINTLEENNKRLKLQLQKSLEENKELMERESEIERTKAEMSKMQELSDQKDLKLNELRQLKSVAQEDMDELRILLEDQGLEMQEYREKYLQAQQRVMELTGELDYKHSEMESVRHDMALEIRTVKAQFQEKLSGMDNIGTMVKELQVKLQESQQQRLLLERGLEEAKRELLHVIDTNNVLQKTLEGERSSRTVDTNERQKLETLLAESELKLTEMRNESGEMMARMARLEEASSHLEQRCIEKGQEVTELGRVVETVRAEAARQLARSKERSDTARRTLQVRVTELERELASARASVKASRRERDEVRHKLQAQINSLTDTLEEGQNRWKSLQSHVTSLQNSLHPNSPLRSGVPKQRRI